MVKHDNAIEAPIAEAEINEQCSKPVLNETRIDYNKLPIKKSKAPWYFKYTAHLYETLKGRYVLASFALFPNLIIYLLFIYVWYTSEKQIPIFSFEILFTVFALALWLPFYAIPSYKVLTLAINKIRSINDYSGFVITEATNEEGILAPLQYFKITGTCPICANNNNLQNSVYIRPIQKSLFVRHLIGERKNNPTVHKLSFDKVTMKGTRFLSFACIFEGLQSDCHEG